MTKIILISLALLVCNIISAAQIHVSSFGAYPGDGLDDTAAINAAIAAGHNNTILFDAGVYDLISSSPHAHCHIWMQGRTGVELRGAVTANGEPNTTLRRHVTVQPMASPPRTAYFYNCTNASIRNFIVENTPQLCTSGEIVEKYTYGNGTQRVRVAIFPGLPMDDGMPCYTANVWDPLTRDLKEGVESLSYTISPGNWSIYDYTNRIMELSSASGLDFYDDIEVGEYVSWHYGWNGDHQMEATTTNGFTVENMLIRNAINMALVVGSSSDILLKDITMQPEGNHLQVGQRDGIHISRCTGTVTATGLDITRVRWDGLVVRSPYARIVEIPNPGTNTLNLAVELNTFSEPIHAGSKLTFIASNGTWTDRIVSSASQYDVINNESYYTVTLTSALPGFAQVGTNLRIAAFTPSSVSISDCDFENIAGASLILLANDITVERTKHRKIMFEAIHMGAHNIEGMTGNNIQVLDSTFDSCGWIPKPGQPAGSIIVYNAHDTAPEDKVRNAVISNNVFSNQLYDPSIPAIYLANAHGINLDNNTFENVYKAMRFESTATGFTLTNNAVVIDNTGNGATFGEVSGNFQDSSLKGYHDSNTRYAWWNGAKAEWTFIAPKSSNYDVYIYVVQHPTSDPNALITVESDNPDAQHNVDYTTGGSGWHLLGNYPYTGQASYTITNQGQGGGYLRADAVMFVQN